MSQSIAIIEPQLPAPRITSATSDDELVDSWLRVKGGKSPNTLAAYSRIANAFRDFFSYRPLASLKIDDLADYADSIKIHSIATQRQRIFAVKSLLSYGQKTGYLQFNVGAALTAPAQKNNLAERFLSEEDIFKLIHAEEKPRNKLLLRLLYVSAARISEALALTWKDLTPRESGGQVALYGKGSKTRFVLIPDPLWSDLNRERAGDDAPVFTSPKSKGKPLKKMSNHWSDIRLKGEGYFFRENTFGHPGYTPYPLMRRMISLMAESLMVDPFCGTGTALRAAKDLGLDAVGIDVNEAYCEIAANRMRQSVFDFELWGEVVK